MSTQPANACWFCFRDLTTDHRIFQGVSIYLSPAQFWLPFKTTQNGATRRADPRRQLDAKDISWRGTVAGAACFGQRGTPQNGSCPCGFPLTLPRKDALQNHRTKLGHLRFLTCFRCPGRTIHKCPPCLVVLQMQPRGSHPYHNCSCRRSHWGSHLFCMSLCRHPHHGLRSWTGVRKVVSYPRKAH